MIETLLSTLSTLSTIAFILLIGSIVIQIIFLLIKKVKSVDPVSHYIFLTCFILLFANTIIRSIHIQFVAVTNTFEALILFSQLILLILFIYRTLNGKKAMPYLLLGGSMLTMMLLAIASSPIAPKSMLPPIPALQSHWLVLHVIFAFSGEAFFAISFVASICYITIRNDESKKKALDRIIYTSIITGYFLYTIGALIFGMIWAQSAWGSYWSWDPKEIWALVTWLVYTAYLHLRLMQRQKGTITAIVSIVGFLVALFTFFGVNFLLSGLHSYK